MKFKFHNTKRDSIRYRSNDVFCNITSFQIALFTTVGPSRLVHFVTFERL